MEGITLTLANAPHDIINRTTVVLGCTKMSYSTQHKFDGWTLASAIVESLRLGYRGFESINPLTGHKCIIRVRVIGIRCDSPMVRWRSNCTQVVLNQPPNITFLLDNFSSQRNSVAGLRGCNYRYGCTYCMYTKETVEPQDSQDGASAPPPKRST